jgi:hypothetical protein
MNITDPGRNRPADEGRDNDPNLRDESALQPGINTVSSSESDDQNDELTEVTASQDDDGTIEDDDADLAFDDDLDEDEEDEM